MVAGRLGTAKAWAALVAWLVESGVDGAAELADPRWEDFTYRQTEAAISRFCEVFGTFARQYGKAELYAEAQRRKIALAPVNDVADLRVDPQLTARAFFVPVADPVLDAEVVYPGRASSIDGNRALMHRHAPMFGEHTAEVLAAAGFAQEQISALSAAGVV
jgi:crotonobetainyl-CoA:carnitine CoA-transferase CaiB-like acyl-CoA transferase